MSEPSKSEPSSKLELSTYESQNLAELELSTYESQSLAGLELSKYESQSLVVLAPSKYVSQNPAKVRNNFSVKVDGKLGSAPRKREPHYGNHFGPLQLTMIEQLKQKLPRQSRKEYGTWNCS